jgi:hypothetical protein
MNLLIALFLILFEAIPEGLADRGKKRIAGVIEFIYRAVITLTIFYILGGFCKIHLTSTPFWQVIVGYVLLRFALFDLCYNLTRKLPVFYIGDTKLFDKFWKWFFKESGIPAEHFLAMVRVISLFIGVTWLV